MASSLVFESGVWETMADVSAHERELTALISPLSLLLHPNALTSLSLSCLFSSFSFSFTRVNSGVSLFVFVWVYIVAKIKMPIVDQADSSHPACLCIGELIFLL